MSVVPFGPWMPDIAAIEGSAAQEALNVVPTLNGYRPMAAFGNTASAITARAQGAISVRDLSGTIHNFCGDATKLYKMASDGLSWNDVTRVSGGAYACPATGWWQFFQFGNALVATNGVDAPQLYTLASSSNFAALGGSPPVAAICGVVRGFGVFLRVSTQWNRVHWSAIEDVADWVASATTLSDVQDLPDSGAIMGFVGGEYGIVFAERSLWRMSFEGPPTTFRFDRITNLLGCRVEGSVAAYESLAFWLSDDGFYMIRGGTDIVAIGAEKVDRWIETDLDASYLYRCTSAIDPIRKLYIFGYPSTLSAGTPDSLIMYHWPTGKWSRAEINHEIIYPAATQSGYTLDGLDSVSASIDALAHSFDSRIWTGSGRLLLSGFDTSHRSGFFDGANLAATVETGDTEMTPGKKTLLRAVMPIVEGTSVAPSITIKRRNLAHEPLTSESVSATNANGVCRVRSKARYHRAQLTIPSGSLWSHAVGIGNFEATEMGKR